MLTRSQANLLKQTLPQIKVESVPHSAVRADDDSDASESSDRGPDISSIDPINFLDKPSFEGIYRLYSYK